MSVCRYVVPRAHARIISGVAKWGFTSEQVSKREHPRIGFMPKEKLPYTAETFAKFNQNEKKSQSKLETSVKMGKVLATKPQTLSRIGSIIDQVENLSDLYSDVEKTKAVLLAMKEGDMITDEGIARLTDENGLLSAQGKDEFETMLAGVIVDEDALRILNNPANGLGDLRKSIAYAVVPLVKNQTLDNYPLVKNQTLGSYSIVKDVSEAVRLYDSARKAGLVGKDGDITNYFINKDFFGGAPMDTRTLTQLLIANQMSKGGYHLKRIIEAYNAEAQSAASGQLDWQTGRVKSKEEILTEILKQQGYDAESIKGRVERLRKAEPPVEGDSESGERGKGGGNAPKGEGDSNPERPADGKRVEGEKDAAEIQQSTEQDGNNNPEIIPSEGNNGGQNIPTGGTNGSQGGNNQGGSNTPISEDDIKGIILGYDNNGQIDARDKAIEYLSKQKEGDAYFGKTIEDWDKAVDFVSKVIAKRLENGENLDDIIRSLGNYSQWHLIGIGGAFLQNTVAQRIKEKQEQRQTSSNQPPLTETQADQLLEQIEAQAVADPEISLTQDAWVQTFGLNNSMQTPIGNVKMGENQYQKLVDKKRTAEFGMVVQTLQEPDVVLIEPSEAKEGQNTERPYSLVFVKTFIRNGEKIKFYASVTVQRDNMEVSVSSHFMNANKVKERLMTLERMYTKQALIPNSSEWHLAEQQNAVPDLLPTQESNASSGGKDSKKTSTPQEKTAKTSEEEYLKPRNDKEKEIISDVEKKLASEIKEAEERVRKAKSDLEKARARESDKATDMFSDDNAFKEEGQLFESEEMPTDRTQEGVNKRTEEQRGELASAEKELERLQSKAEHDSRVRGALDNERRQTSIDPLETAEKIANEERKKKDEEIGITRNETPEQQADKENADKLSDQPLTAEEIDGANVSDVQKTLAKAYLGGNHGVLQTAAYLNTYNDVRNRRKDGTGDSPDAERGAQLDSGENQPEQRPGRVGGSDLGMAETEGTGQDQGRQLRVEDDKGQLHTPAGEGGDRGVSGAEPAVDGVHTGGVEPVGGSKPRVKRSDVRRGESDKGGSGDTGKPAAGSDAAISASKQRLAELRKRFKNAKHKGELSISLVGMNNEQIGILGEIITESANLGYQYIAKGLHEFKEWSKQMLDDFHDWLAEDMKWSDADIDDYMQEVWNCEYNIDGVTRTIGEWASFIGQEKMRQVVREDLSVKFEKQKAAEGIEVKTGDIDNIRETLPYLLPEQQDDVLKAETQFFDEGHSDREHGYGKGMMFTNGTGTGKTYTGLGIVKRFVKQGKGRVLILTPSQEKVNDWRKDGLNLGLELESLDEDAKNQGVSATKAKGRGVVVTTYANARQNLKMLEDCFDLVVYDESHKIMESKDATGTTMNFFHEMLTNKNVERSVDRQTYYLPEWVEMRNLRKEENDIYDQLMKLESLADPTAEQKELQASLNARMLEIASRKQELIPIMEEIRKSKEPQAKIDTKRTKTVFLSATPFNVRESLRYAEGYLFSFPEENKNTIGTYNHRTPEDAFFEQMFPAGYRWRYGRLEHHISNAEALARQEIDFSDYLQNALQTMSGRMIASDYDYSRDFPVLTLDNAGRFNQAMSEIYRNKRYNAIADAFRKSFDYNYSTALFEAMKTSLVSERIREHLKRGQKVVVFHRRRTSEGLEPPFRRALDYAEMLAAQETDGKRKTEIRNAIKAFEEDFADMLEWEKTIDYTLPREQIEKAFGKEKVAFFSGAENKKTKHQSVKDFMKDKGGKDIIVIQEASGKEGISLHDKTGEHQRVEINLALPQSPIAFIQIEGRIYRIGQKSNAIFEYPLLGLDLETSLFAQKFNSALGTTENLALGSKARNLRKSIATSVLESTGEVDYERQGLGGKDLDGRVSGGGEKDGFDMSIQDYYGNQKMQRGRDNREGVDYFPTPEPIGYKMVEWAQLTEGETALEPSAGHGAIARYVPETNGMTAIEPSANLFTRLQMRAGGPGRRFEEMTFEDYPVGNKHDTVLMNPPYGVGGKTAMEHVAKAFRHLNEGGRLIAIIPDGPAMEKRFDAWINDSNMGGAAVLVGEVKLPSVAFGRAGTSVRTRVVVIDKVTRKEMRDGMSSMESYDLSREESIGGLFDRIRNIRMPERTIDTVAINEKKARRTERQLKDNPFTKEFSFRGSNLFIESKSRYDMPTVYLNLENPNVGNILHTYKSLKEKAEHPEKVDYGKWVDRNFGRGDKKVNGLDAIKDYCEQCIKTLENVSGMTADQMDRMIREREEARVREEQERMERQERERQERLQKRDAAISAMVKDYSGNEDLTYLENLMNRAHGNTWLSQNAKERLKELGVDWETGRMTDKNEPVNARTATVVEPQKPAVPEPARQEAGYEYKLDKNTRTGEDMHLVNMKNRLSDSDYKAVGRKAKALGGYYNRFKKAWHFPTEADAKKFVNSVNDNGGVHYKFSESKQEFDKIREEAVKSKGLVIKGLGDVEVKVTKVPKHDFVGTGKQAIKSAKEWAKKNLIGEHKGIDSSGDEFTYHIDNEAIGKFLSQSSTGNSDNLGAHLAVLKELPSVIKNSIEAEIHPDYLKDGVEGRSSNSIIGEDELVHRFYGAAEIDGKVYRVKTTILEKRGNGKSKPHDYKVTKVDVILDGGSSTSNAPRTSTIAGAKLLKDVEKSYDKGKKLLDESKKVSQNTVFQPSDGEIDGIHYKLREKEAPKKTGIGYKVFVLKDGKLYPPMVANPNGAETPVGVWLDADAAPVSGTSKTGRPQVKAGGKGTQGGSGQLAYRPGWHLGEIPYAKQFNRKNPETGERELFPNNFVWAEVEYANDVDYQEEARKEGINANGKYQHSLAGLKHLPTDGSYRYRTNPDPTTDEWVITGAMKVNRILSRQEVDDMVRNAGREPQPIQEGDTLTQETVDRFNSEIANAPKYRLGEDSDNIESADRIRTHAAKIANRLNVGNEMKVHDSVDDITNSRVRADIEAGKPVMGWYDEADNSVHLYMPNIRNRYEAESTIRHEFIGHRGMRDFLGDDNYKTYMRELWMDGTKDSEWDDVLSGYVARNLHRHNYDLYDTIDEFLAEEAESRDDKIVDLWFKVRNSLENVLSKMGFDEGLSISDVKYMVWLSKNHLRENDPLSEARRNALRYRLERNATPMPMYDNGRSYLKEGVHYKQSKPYHLGMTPAAINAVDEYHRQLNRTSYVWTEAYVDYAVGLKKAMESIAGTDIMNIKDSENAYLAENHMSSVEQQAEMKFTRDHLEPLQEAMNKLLPDLDSDPIEAQKKLESYMQVKHGLERNREFFVRDYIKDGERNGTPGMDKLQADWNDEKEQLRSDLRNESITYREYLEGLDKFIKLNVDNGFDPDKDLQKMMLFQIGLPNIRTSRKTPLLMKSHRL